MLLVRVIYDACAKIPVHRMRLLTHICIWSDCRMFLASHSFMPSTVRIGYSVGV